MGAGPANFGGLVCAFHLECPKELNDHCQSPRLTDVKMAEACGWGKPAIIAIFLNDGNSLSFFLRRAPGIHGNFGVKTAPS